MARRADEHSYIVPQLRSLAVPIDTLVEDDKNPRVHSDANIAAIAASIRAKGQDQPIVVRKEDRVISKGHGRLRAMKSLGHTHIAAVVVDETRLSAIERGLADNRSSDLASMNEVALAAMLETVRELDGVAIGWSEDELTTIMLDAEQAAASAQVAAERVIQESVQSVPTPQLSAPTTSTVPRAETGIAQTSTGDAEVNSAEYTVIKLTVARDKMKPLMERLHAAKTSGNFASLGDALVHLVIG